MTVGLGRDDDGLDDDGRDGDGRDDDDDADDNDADDDDGTSILGGGLQSSGWQWVLVVPAKQKPETVPWDQCSALQTNKQKNKQNKNIWGGCYNKGGFT